MWFWLLLFSLAFLFFYLKPSKSIPIVTDIIIYPLKSCGAVHLKSVDINDYGIKYDRQWILITPDNKIVSQYEDTRLLKLQPNLIFENSQLTSIELLYNNNQISFYPQKTGEIVAFECMQVHCEGINEGKAISDFFQKNFQQEYRLIRITKHREVNKHPRFKGVSFMNQSMNFANYTQFLVISEESYLKTKKTLGKNIDIGCFRGNIVVKGCKAFEEETWARFRIGNVEFEGVARCPRCKFVTVNRDTLEYDKDFEPVNTLRKINGNGIKGYLGMNCIKHNTGEIQVGQAVLVSKSQKFPDI